MFFGFDLKEIFMFPFKDEEARKYLLIGGLVSIAVFFIPVVPYLILMGYSVQIIRQILRGESPRMIPWEDWGGMLKDGAKLFGVRIIYTLPILILTVPLVIFGIAVPFIAEGMNGQDAEALIATYTIIMVAGSCLIVPLSIPLALIVPVAELHIVEKDDFTAAFRIKDWWQVFRANIGGFIAALGIYYAISMVLAIVIQILAATVILACLLIVLIPAMTVYITLIMYVTVAIAYRDGKAKLNQPA